MTVYVGPSNYPYGRMVMCHMVADSLQELHDMAGKLGLLIWFQSHARIPHYDISKTKRAVAISLGAIETDERQIVQVGRALAGRPAMESMSCD